MKRTFGKAFNVSLVIAFAVIGAFAQAKPIAQQRPTDKERDAAERLWEKIIEAKGGREKLHSVTNMLVTKGDSPDDLGVFFYVFPNKSWSWTKGPPSPKTIWVGMTNLDYRVSLVADNQGLLTNNEVSRERHDNIIKENLREACSYLLDTRWCQPRPLRVTRLTIDDRKFDVVETRIEDKETGYVDRIDFAVEPESLLVSRVFDYGGNPDRTEPLGVICFDNYHLVDGIQMPQASYSRIFHKLTDKCYFHPLSVRTNVEYDKQLFEKPPTVEAGSNAWKPKVKE